MAEPWAAVSTGRVGRMDGDGGEVSLCGWYSFCHLASLGSVAVKRFLHEL